MDGLPADMDGDCRFTTDSVLHDVAAIPIDQAGFEVAPRPVGHKSGPQMLAQGTQVTFRSCGNL